MSLMGLLPTFLVLTEKDDEPFSNQKEQVYQKLSPFVKQNGWNAAFMASLNGEIMVRYISCGCSCTGYVTVGDFIRYSRSIYGDLQTAFKLVQEKTLQKAARVDNVTFDSFLDECTSLSYSLLKKSTTPKEFSFLEQMVLSDNGAALRDLICHEEMPACCHPERFFSKGTSYAQMNRIIEVFPSNTYQEMTDKKWNALMKMMREKTFGASTVLQIALGEKMADIPSTLMELGEEKKWHDLLSLVKKKCGRTVVLKMANKVHSQIVTEKKTEHKMPACPLAVEVLQKGHFLSSMTASSLKACPKMTAILDKMKAHTRDI